MRTGIGLTGKELSLRIQAHPTFISRIERGFRTVDVVEFLDIVEALGLEPQKAFSEFLDRVAAVRSPS